MLRNVLLALALLFASPALAQTGTPQTKTLLNTETTTNFPDNSSGLITPLITRQSIVDYIASWQQAPRVNAQTGTSYTVVVDDFGKLVTFTNGSATAVTLPQATTTFANFNFFACNKGAGAVTITPTTSTINGATTLVLVQNDCAFIVSDGTNYQAPPPPITGCTTGLVKAGAAGNCQLTAARQTLPTVQNLTSGTNATYTTPANVLWIEITIIGGGGGGGGGGTGGGSGSNGGDTCWNTSGTACTSPVYQAGKGNGFSTGSGAAGGTVSGSGTCQWSVAGGGGSFTIGVGPATAVGVAGGNSSRGGAGGGGTNAGGGAGAANSGSGGGGGGVSTNTIGGGSGGAGATCYAIINSPAATYTYTVGASGGGGTAGTSGGAGGAGGTGVITVIEHYGS